MLKIGDMAPLFSLPNEEGKIISLNDLKGKKVILYFYPKDNTSGCTQEALEFSALTDEFKDLNAVVIGVSKDSVKSHINFKNKYNLPFILLSDEKIEMLPLYDVYQEKSMYGRKYMGIVRSTFVIDEEGIIIKADYNVKPKETAACVLNFIKK